MKNSVLLFGGGSDERLVSVASAQNLCARFPFGELWFVHESGAISRATVDELTRHQNAFQDRFHPREPAFANSIRESLPKLEDKVVFMGFHGTEGEDGTVQKLFEDAAIPYTGSDSRASRACFDKVRAKEVVAEAGLPTAPQVMASSEEPVEATRGKLQAFLKTHGKIILKPIANGSSFGLFVIQTEAALEAALTQIHGSRFGSYLAEKFIKGRELTVGVLQRGNELTALPASEVIMNEGRSFDYEGKYLGQGSTEVTPAELNAAEMESAKKLSLAAHRALGCYGYTRTDMILTPKGLVYLETNTLPGLTKASFVPQQLAAVGIEMREFVEAQLQLAQHRAK